VGVLENVARATRRETGNFVRDARGFSQDTASTSENVEPGDVADHRRRHLDVAGQCLAVAGAARDHPHILIFGLGLSIALMGIAAQFIAGLLDRHRWMGLVGLAIIVYVAVEMIYRGSLEVWPVLFG
jgi:hypothetical protein